DYLLANIPAIASCTHHFVSCDLGCVKPEAAYFDAISERLGTRDILFFDDTPANVTAAKAAGWQAWHYTGQTCLADFGISP
ncbi:MAG: HAD-IA family hydrolase, partial [Pseudomonadales bacterium]|nr:HAD-IA family hydrolase [Pseudomonadales bacterium]